MILTNLLQKKRRVDGVSRHRGVGSLPDGVGFPLPTSLYLTKLVYTS